MLPEVSVGLDYSGSKATHIFVSHAHADHIPTNRRLSVFATPPTAAFMKLRGFKEEITELDFRQPMETDNARVTFYPAGHILGSAMTFVESDQGSVLYTGDYRTPIAPTTKTVIILTPQQF